MKAYIMTDLEGVSGVNGRSDGIGNKIINTEVACRMLTQEVNACVEGLVEAGVEEVLVVDAHGGSNSISPEQLHPKATLKMIGGGVAPVISVDASFDVALHIGTHAMIGVPAGFLSHTFNSHAVADMRLNGIRVGEIAIEALLTGYHGVPTVLLSGDRAACGEALEFLGKVETVETKVALSRYSAVNRNPASVQQDLREASRRAALERETFPIRHLPPPYVMEIQLMCPNQADAYEMRGAKRVDHQTVVLESDDLVDLWAQRNGWAPGVHGARFPS